MYTTTKQDKLGSIWTKLKKDKSLWRGIRTVIDTAASAAAASAGIPIDAAMIRGAGTTQEAIQIAAGQIAAAPMPGQQIPGSTTALNIPKEYLYIGAALMAFMMISKR